jgi:hypothetical protein
MNRRWGSRPIFRRLLVLVLAAQAITPDCCDLASSALFQLVLLFNSVGSAVPVGTDVALPYGESTPAGRDPSSPDPADQDEASNEVGLPCRRLAGMPVQQRGGGTNHRALYPYGSRRHLDDSHVRCLSPRGGGDSRSGGPLVSFYRLIC